MPTAPTTFQSAPTTFQSDANTGVDTKIGVKPAGPAGRRSGSTVRRASQTRATRAKTRRTRARSTGRAPGGARRPSGRGASDRSTGILGEYAERAILIPVGAALIARERVVGTVNDTLSSYSSSSKAQAQLRRFERRGATARKRLEREVRKTRVRVERELRQRRREIERTVSDLDERRGAVAKNSADLANRVPELVNRVQERIQERVLNFV
jgi:hypothetical protein